MASNSQSDVQHRHEMFVHNDLIGCVIGRGGMKINEIRRNSQANIRISGEEDGTTNRRIVITGSRDAVRIAHDSITDCIELHKHIIAMHLAMQSLCLNPDQNKSVALSTDFKRHSEMKSNFKKFHTNLRTASESLGVHTNTTMTSSSMNQTWPTNVESFHFRDLLNDQISSSRLQTPQINDRSFTKPHSALVQNAPLCQEAKNRLPLGQRFSGSSAKQSSSAGSSCPLPVITTPFMSAVELNNKNYELSPTVQERSDHIELNNLILHLSPKIKETDLSLETEWHGQ